MSQRRVNELTLRKQQEGYVTVSDAASIAGVNIVTVYRWIDRRWIKGDRIGRARFVNLASLKNFIGSSNNAA